MTTFSPSHQQHSISPNHGRSSEQQPPVGTDRLAAEVQLLMSTTPVWDLHTHLYPATFGSPTCEPTGSRDPNGLALWGIDELLTYHYLVAEVFRVVPPCELPYEQFWKMSKQEQADHIWQHLFLDRTPISEACRGVLTTLERLGLDPGERDLASYRKWFQQQSLDSHIDRVMQIAGISRITMTNPVFDDNERNRWLADESIGDDPRFAAVLRFDPLLRDWDMAGAKLREWGYEVSQELSAATIAEVRRFIRDWVSRIKAIYCAVSLPPGFRYGGSDDLTPGSTIFRDAVLPTLAELGLPMAMMIGSELQVNPSLGDAGDTVGKSDVQSVIRLCHDFPENRFLVTMLARENQHELAVAARKFGNLMVFGCWWFLNNPSLVEEITRMRVELLGTSFVPQHSDARVLEQLIYKWEHSRAIIAKVLVDKYNDVEATGWKINEEEIRRDVQHLLSGAFEKFLAR
ncbi:hypothetical protein [Aeoliella mucimassa]|uniref:Glucuronate isomerase n=1 Tax=Aeoliella mucimassa TaxID=2527972 RepID=A0A518AMF9_9BACT|nr:hypothetical protein [Aeoliella mucimassa]QDU55893.1 hypothetical protein Pan181_20900 [Aeoliella mucimassa]